MADNLEIYNKIYTPSQLCLNPATAYDRFIIKMRFAYIEKFGTGRDVVDLCCGNGAYLIPLLAKVRSAVGVDFSSTMLNDFKQQLGGNIPEHLTLCEEDVSQLSLAKESCDFLFSFCSLYYAPQLEKVLSEVSRVLRPGGIAVFELGNKNSLAQIVGHVQHRQKGWARLYGTSYSEMKRILATLPVEVIEWRSFQTLPLYGAPKELLFLYPLLSSHWKKLMAWKFRGKILDEWLSNTKVMRHIAFRHFIVVQKR